MASEFGKLIGKKCRVYKRNEKGEKTDEILFEGHFQGIVLERAVNPHTNMLANFHVGAVFDGKYIHKATLDQLEF